MSSLLDSRARVRAFRGHYSEFAQRNFFGISGRMKARSEVRSSANSQATRFDGAGMLLRNVVGVYFDIREMREVRAENAADRPATDNANFDTHAVLRASSPV